MFTSYPSHLFLKNTARSQTSTKRCEGRSEGRGLLYRDAPGLKRIRYCRYQLSINNWYSLRQGLTLYIFWTLLHCSFFCFTIIRALAGLDHKVDEVVGNVEDGYAEEEADPASRLSHKHPHRVDLNRPVSVLHFRLLSNVNFLFIYEVIIIVITLLIIWKWTENVPVWAIDI